MASRHREAPAAGGPLDAVPLPRPAGRVPAALVERISTKLQAALWVAGAALLLTKGGVAEAAGDPARSNAFFIYAGLAALSANLAIGLYCVVWVRRVQGSEWPWEIVAPGAIEAAALAMVAAMLAFTVGLWPAFGLLTPLVVGFITMGALFSTHFLPAC